MSLIPKITVEQSAFNALQSWLQAGLPQAQIDFSWPSPEQALPRQAITILRAGVREDDFTDPEKCGEETIHTSISSMITTADPANNADLPGSVALVNACRLSYEAHRIDVAVHQAADLTNAITAPIASDLPSAILLAEDIRAQLSLHETDLIPHATGDSKNAVAVPTAVDIGTLVTLVKAVKRALNRHYVARIDVWRIRYCRLPVQLDVWATYEATRDELLAKLEPLLNADPYDSAGIGWFSGNDPVRNGVIVQLGDGWSGTADFVFGQPRLLQTESSQQVSEFRAIYTGFCDLPLMVKAQSPRLAQIALRQSIDASASIKTTTVTAYGTTNEEN